MISFKKFLIEQHILLERPSIEDQIETGNATILDVGSGRTKGYAKAGNVTVPFDISVDPSLPERTRGQFRYSKIAVNRALNPSLWADVPETIPTVALNPKIKINDDDLVTAVKNQDTIAHEAGGHGHQLAAKMRDAQQRQAEGKTTYADVEASEIEKASAKSSNTSNTRLSSISPEVQSDLDYSRYYLSPDEVNARSAGAGTMSYRVRSGGGGRNYSFSLPKISSEVDLDFVAGGSKASPEEMAAMTRHERSVAKRKNILARKDLRDASARGVLKAEQEMGFINPESEATKARQAAIKAKIETLKGKTEQPIIPTAEATPTKGQKIASGIIDPTSAAIEFSTSQASKIAPRAAMNPIPGTQIKGVGTGLAVGAGILGGLAGEHVVKPTAEKLGVFNAVEKGTRAALSNTPNWVANTADAGLGAAQAILDPINALAPVVKQGFETKINKEVDSMINAGKPSQVRFIGPKF